MGVKFDRRATPALSAIRGEEGPEADYRANSDGEMGNLRANDEYFWDEFDYESYG